MSTPTLNQANGLPAINEPPQKTTGEPSVTESEVKTATKLPDSVIIKVPFLAQAPLANWDAIHEEACEEASLIMVKHFLDKTDIPSPESGDKEILALVDFENKNGFGPSITLEQLNQIAKTYYNLSGGKVETDVSIEKIQTELANNRPVIIPAAGKILPNPNFRNGGPNYHMLVIIGYDNGEFITNDPGTKKGQYFRYKYNDLLNAIHDWDPTNILNGPKSYLTFLNL